MAPKAMSYKARQADLEMREARATVDENKVEAARRLRERWIEKHPDKPPPDFEAVQEWVMDSMDDESGDVFEIDGGYVVVVNTRTKANRRARKARDDYEDQIRFERNGVLINYGPDVARDLGLEAEPERERYMALAQGKSTVQRFDDLNLEEISPLPGRAKLDLAEVRTRIFERVDRLDTLLDEHDKRKKEAQAKRAVLDEELDRYRSSYGHLIGIEKRLLSLAGLEDAARRLRPPKRRRTRSKKKEETPPETPSTENPQGPGETPDADPA